MIVTMKTALLASFATLCCAVEPQSVLKEAPVCLNPDCSEDTETTAGGANECSLYLAESALQPGKFGLFAGTPRKRGERVAEPDIIIPMIDANKNEWSPWHDIFFPAANFPSVLLESRYFSNVFLPGVSSMIACSNKYINVEAEEGELVNSDGVHRNTDPSFGAFSYIYNSSYIFSQDVEIGEELAIGCMDDTQKSSGRKVLSESFLKSTAICLGSVDVGPSTIPNIGRGAFAKQTYATGDVITPSPVLHFDRSQMEILEQELYDDQNVPSFQREHGVRYTDKVVAQQLMLNYAYGHKDSTVLLLPFGPCVNFINHSKDPNVKVRWSNHPAAAAPFMKSQRPMELFDIAAGDKEMLVIEYVATRSIAPGEELFIDYQSDWREAWNEQVDEWIFDEDTEEFYVSAADYSRMHPDELIRTVEEAEEDPYPETLRTICYFSVPEYYDEENEWDESTMYASYCPRPCDVEDRYHLGDGTFYSVTMYEMDNLFGPDDCGIIPDGGLHVENVPHEYITIGDTPYSTDLHFAGAFRHEIGLPDGFFPKVWDHKDPKPKGDFIPTPLKPGQLDHVYWADNGAIVTDHAYRLGLSEQLRTVLLEYCNKMGITDMLRHVTSEGNGLKPGQETHVQLDGDEWYMQRPGKYWSSNLHWLSPAGFPAHENYLQALSAAGFDEMLKGIGEHLKMDGLVAFHVTFIAVSQAIRGYLHIDVTKTQAKTYNVIIPLELAEDTGPELDLWDNNDD